MQAAKDITRVSDYLLQLQQNISTFIQSTDPNAKLTEDHWDREDGGGGRSRVYSGGDIFEQAGVNYSHVFGDKLPPSATANRPALAGRGFQAMGLSLVFHPHNPYVPTTHCNVRFFIAEKENEEPVWWFGGGFDLTPYYTTEEDCRHWHQTAKDEIPPTVTASDSSNSIAAAAT